MTNREKILEFIRIEVATNGKITRHATRLYIENRISYEAFQAACDRGMAQFNSIKQDNQRGE